MINLSKWRAIAIVVVAGVLTFWNGLSSPLLYDDAASVLQNSSIRDVADVPAVLSPPAETPVAGRPLANLSFALNYAAGGIDPLGYRVTNLALHLMCAIVLLLLIEQATASTPVALAVALLWTVHPINSEVVDYVTQRTESLMALAMLLTIWWSRPSKGRPLGRPVLAVLACAAGMACKETMVVAPVLVVLIDRVMLFCSMRETLAARGRLYVALVATWVLLGYLVLSHGQTTNAGFARLHVTSLTYFLNQPAMIARYLTLMFWPGPLVLYYGWTPQVTAAQVWLPTLVVSVLGVASLVALLKRPRIGLLCVMFFVWLAPTSSCVPIATEVAAERRMYLPSMAIITLLLLAGAWIIRRGAERRLITTSAAQHAATIVVVACGVALATRTVYRNAEYRSPLAMSKSILDRWPSGNAHQLYGVALSADGQHDAALEQYRLALQRGYPVARYFLGADLIDLGRTDEGVRELQQFIREEPNLETADASRSMLADVFVARRQFDDAAVQYRAFLQRHPRDGNAWTGLAVALISANHLREALDAFRSAVSVDPYNGEYRANLERAEKLVK